MSCFSRRVGRFGVLALAGLAILVPQADAQRIPSTVGLQSAVNLNRINPNFFVAPGLNLNQAAFNTAVIGRAAAQIPPGLLGFNPFPQVAGFPTIVPSSPFGLSTVPGSVGGFGGGAYGASLATNPYGGGGLGGGGYGGAATYGYSGYDLNSPGAGFLQGAAGYMGASGQYWKDIQTASMMREQTRQAALETLRKRMQEEAAYERMRPTAQDVRDREMASELSRARKDPPLTDIWSGRSLNELLRSINSSGRRLKDGGTIPVEDEVLKNINLTDAASRGNIGLLKDGGKLKWPTALEDPNYDEARKRLSRNLVLAVQQLKDKDPLQPGTLADLRADFKTINDRLAANVGDLPPSQYIEARRYLNQLDDAIRALEDPKALNYFNNSWVAKGKNVAELVDHMKTNGLKFAPATPGDEGAYTSLYYALRNFENALQVANK